MTKTRPAFVQWLIDHATCAVCNVRPVDPDHIKTRGASGNRYHEYVAPLCRKHHNERHAMGIATFQRRYAIDLHNVHKKWLKRYEASVEEDGASAA